MDEIMEKKRIKIFGERNTGTNYLERLIDRNFNVTLIPGTIPFFASRILRKLSASEVFADMYFRYTGSRNLGWKHREVDPGIMIGAPRGLYVLALVKNPYAWLLSMFRRPYHYMGAPCTSFEEFLQRPWPALARESATPTFRNIVHLWNRKTRSYMTLADHEHCRIVRYEDLLSDVFSEMEEIRQFTGAPIQACFPANYEVPAKRSDANLGADYYRSYYGQERWRSKLTRQNIDFINQHIDCNLVESLEYEVL